MNTTCICVLNYNNGPETIRCIAGILDQTLQDYRLMIIDNHSTDDSVDVISEFLEKNRLHALVVDPGGEQKKILPGPGEAIIFRSGKNGGYSYGNNLGIKLAKSLSVFSYLLIINNDCVLKENFLEEMVRHYEELRNRYKTEKIALGATERGEDGKVHHKGFHYLHLLSGITFFSPVFPSFKYIPGSCIFADTGTPLMDESFFLYFDDTQYSKILRRNGYILAASPRSIYIHEAGGTVKENIHGMIFKSLRRFYLLNYPCLLPVVVPVRLLLIAYLRIKEKLHYE